MINSEYLINDGLTSTCENNNQTVWTYNQVCYQHGTSSSTVKLSFHVQGVILGGLLHLYLYTQNQTYIDLAVKLANASSTLMVYPNGLSNCSSD